MNRPKPGPWKVQSNTIGDTRKYIVFRQKDMSKLLHSGNMEHRGGYVESEEAAQHLCDQLNRETA